MPAIQWQLKKILDLLESVPASSISIGAKSVTDTPAHLDEAECQEVIIQADGGNTKNILVGNSSAQTIVLSKTVPLSLKVNDANLVYLVSEDTTEVTANYIVLQ